MTYHDVAVMYVMSYVIENEVHYRARSL